MKETSRFYSSLGLLIVLNLVIKPLWIFGIDRQVQNELGTAAYGAYFSLLNFSILFSFLLDWGIGTYFNRQLAAKELPAGQAGSFVLIKLLLAVVYTAIVCVAALLTGINNWPLLFSLIAIQVLSSLFLFFRGILTAQQWFRTDAWISVLDKILMILVCGSFLYFPAIAGNITLQKFLFAQVACVFIALLVTIIVLLSKGTALSFTTIRLPGKKFMKTAFPFAVIVLLMSVHSRLDGFLLQQLKDDNEAGLYAGAYRLLDAANMTGYLVASFLLPYIARNRHDGPLTIPVILASRHFLLIVSTGISIAVLFLAPWLQQILYYNNDPVSIELLQWCMPVLVAYSITHIYGTVLTASGHLVAFCYITLAAVIMNAILNCWLIPGWGAKGSCIAALISQGSCGIATLWYAAKKCGQPVHARSLLFYTFIAGLLCGSFYLFSKIEIHPVLQLVAAGLIATTVSIALGLLKWDKWKTVINK